MGLQLGVLLTISLYVLPMVIVFGYACHLICNIKYEAETVEEIQPKCPHCDTRLSERYSNLL